MRARAVSPARPEATGLAPVPVGSRRRFVFPSLQMRHGVKVHVWLLCHTNVTHLALARGSQMLSGILCLSLSHMKSVSCPALVV